MVPSAISRLSFCVVEALVLNIPVYASVLKSIPLAVSAFRVLNLSL